MSKKYILGFFTIPEKVFTEKTRRMFTTIGLKIAREILVIILLVSSISSQLIVSN